MSSKDRRTLQVALVALLVATLFVSINVHQAAQTQTKTQLAAPTSHVDDLAGVLDDQTKQRIETMLNVLGQRNKIDFYVALVETTSGQDIFDFSRQLAHDWDIGSRTTPKKSLLLVVSVNDKVAFTQFSRSVQNDLPDGILGEMSQRMRPAIAAGNFNDAVKTGIDHFVGAVARKTGLSLQDFETPANVASVTNAPAPSPVPDATPLPAATAEPTPVVSSSPEVIAPETTRARSVKAKGRRSAGDSAAIKPAPKKNESVDDEAEAEEVELTLTLPFEPRVAKLKEFLATHPRSKVRDHATELLISAYAALGDQKLREGDLAGGTEQLFLAIDQAPANMTEKLFAGVIAQIPLNLYLIGEHTSAFKAAQNIESRFGNDAKRLLAIAAFYLRVEIGDEAVRVATEAVKLAPDMAEAHQALAVALHISLRLDEAMAEYKRTLDLDPSAKGIRRNLADMNRATGKTEEALALYREQLNADPGDKAARAGLVISLLETGKRQEANAELEAALKDDPRNLALLTGAAYWFAAHDESEKSLELARQAVEIEPRYTWAQIAAARALLARRQPLQAERAIRFARQYGKFPTLDYELASALSAAGLYDEAAEILQPSFTVRNGEIETRLGGRKPAHAATFPELLAPERRASIFQFTAADNAVNAQTLKALLTFQSVLGGSDGKVDEAAAVAAARDFAAGEDDMRVFRQLYAATRLLRKSIGFSTVYDLTEAARSGIETAMLVPAVTLAVQADEYRDLRARAIASGGTPDVQEAPRNVLANILRGKIEDLSGWALFNQEKPADAIRHLRNAAAILPEGTPAWRTSLWHLGAALEQTDSKEEALGYYIKSYLSEPDPLRRPLIEQLYRKVHGTLDGLDQQLSGSTTAAVASPTPETSAPANATGTQGTSSPVETATPSIQPVATTPAPSPEVTAAPSPAAVVAPPDSGSGATEKTPAGSTETSASPTPSPAEATPTPTPAATPSEEQAIAQAAARLRATIKISGRIKDADGKGIPNVVVILISPRGTVLVATTDAEGNYSFNIAPSQRSYRLVPSKEDLKFDPVDRAVVAFTDDLKGIDFVVSRSP